MQLVKIGDLEFRKSGIPHPDALGILRTIQPLRLAKASPLTRLDFLLTNIKKYHPNIIKNYMENLQERYEIIVVSDMVAKFGIDVPSTIDGYSMLKQFPGLASSNLNFFLHILNPPDGIDIENDVIEVSQRKQLRAVLCPKYQSLLTLTETIGRREAFEIYKKYHDDLARINHSTKDDRYKTLEEFANRWNSESDQENPGLIRYISDVKDGKLYLKKENCLWNDAISDLQDSEVKYHICCYGDFEGARQANRHFVLTMERTIIEGYTYCDSVFHDTRIDDELVHPSDDFFDQIRI